MTAVLQLLRPLQWTKNLFVFAAMLFAQRALDPSAARASLVAFAAFCLLASGVYALNDVIDRDKDRGHARNRERPVAAGRITPFAALAVAFSLWSLGLVLASRLPALFLAVALLYVANSVLYCLAAKRIVILDVFSIVFGYFLRVVGGAAAIGAVLSHWIVVCTVSLALLLAACKRRAEMAEGEKYKEVLGSYTHAMLDQMIAISAGLSLLSYMLYTIAPETIAKFDTDHLLFTIPFVLYGIFRYLYLVFRARQGENPAQALFRDVPSLVNGALYAGAVFLILYRR